MSALWLGMLAASASAQAVEFDLHAWGALGHVEQPEDHGLGLGAGLGWALASRLHLGLNVEGGLSSTVAPWVAARPELRFFPADRRPTRAAFSTTLGAGVRVNDTLHPDLALGGALDLPGERTTMVRVQARTLLDVTGGGHAVTVGVGIAWPRPQPPAVEPAPVVSPPPEAPAASAAEKRIWVPHPLRQCVMEGQVRAATEGSNLEESAIPPGLDLEALLRPTQGSLIVAARPWDRVRVAGAELPLRADGTVVSTMAEGPVDIEVVGAGRLRRLETAVAAGHALWVRGDSEDTPHRILFEAGSAEISAVQRRALATIAANAGAWNFQLRGMFSPEGDPEANRALAQKRAEAVRDELLALGMSPTRINLLAAPEASDPTLPAQEQRACELIPIAGAQP